MRGLFFRGIAGGVRGALLALVGLSGCDRPLAPAAPAVMKVAAAQTPVPEVTVALTAAPTATVAATATAEPRPETPMWRCDLKGEPLQELLIYRRTKGGRWNKITPVVDGHEGGGKVRDSVLRPRAAGHACAFVDANHAWVAALNAEYELQVYRTVDGGRTWEVSTVADEAHETSIELHFRDAKHGKTVFITGGGHPWGYVEKLVTYKTADGGKIWRQLSVRCRYEDRTAFIDCPGWAVPGGW